MINKVEKVVNLELEEKFEMARLYAFDDFWDFKFHGTSKEAVDSIISEGFRMPRCAGMFGRGIYFATDSSKSAQERYTKGSQTLVMCKVLLGKSKVLITEDRSITFEKLKQEGFDSVYAPRDSKETGGVFNDEFVVYRPEYALPYYIIHYANNTIAPTDAGLRPSLELGNLSYVCKCGHKTFPARVTSDATPSPFLGQTFIKKNVKASWYVNKNDPFETAYQQAEWHFLRMAQKFFPYPKEYEVESIDIVLNSELERRFNAKASELKTNGGC